MLTRDAEWKEWGKATSPDGGASTRLVLGKKTERPRSELVARLDAQLRKYWKHNDIATWQSAAIKAMRLNLRPGQIWVQLDFSEKYTPQPSEEIQSAYWSPGPGITLLPMVIYRVAGPVEALHDLPVAAGAQLDGAFGGARLIREEYAFLSDIAGNEQNYMYIQAALRELVGSLRDRLGADAVKELLISSDNCCAQNKCGAVFFGMDFLVRELKLVRVRWSHTGPNHGKGEADGSGGGIKAFLQTALRRQLWAGTFAAQAVEMLNKGYTKSAPSSYAGKLEDGDRQKRFFFHLTREQLDQEQVHVPRGNSVPGSAKLYSFVADAGTAERHSIMAREFACGCVACMDAAWGDCENVTRVGLWKEVKIQLGAEAASDVAHQAELNAEMERNCFADVLEAGMNVAVAARFPNEDGPSYTILQLVGPAFVDTRNDFPSELVAGGDELVVVPRLTEGVRGYRYRHAISPNDGRVIHDMLELMPGIISVPVSLIKHVGIILTRPPPALLAMRREAAARKSPPIPIAPDDKFFKFNQEDVKVIAAACGRDSA